MRDEDKISWTNKQSFNSHLGTGTPPAPTVRPPLQNKKIEKIHAYELPMITDETGINSKHTRFYIINYTMTYPQTDDSIIPTAAAFCSGARR